MAEGVQRPYPAKSLRWSLRKYQLAMTITSQDVKQREERLRLARCMTLYRRKKPLPAIGVPALIASTNELLALSQKVTYLNIKAALVKRYGHDEFELHKHEVQQRCLYAAQTHIKNSRLRTRVLEETDPVIGRLHTLIDETYQSPSYHRMKTLLQTEFGQDAIGCRRSSISTTLAMRAVTRSHGVTAATLALLMRKLALYEPSLLRKIHLLAYTPCCIRLSDAHRVLSGFAHHLDLEFDDSFEGKPNEQLSTLSTWSYLASNPSQRALVSRALVPFSSPDLAISAPASMPLATVLQHVAGASLQLRRYCHRHCHDPLIWLPSLCGVAPEYEGKCSLLRTERIMAYQQSRRHVLCGLDSFKTPSCLEEMWFRLWSHSRVAATELAPPTFSKGYTAVLMGGGAMALEHYRVVVDLAHYSSSHYRFDREGRKRFTWNPVIIDPLIRAIVSRCMWKSSVGDGLCGPSRPLSCLFTMMRLAKFYNGSAEINTAEANRFLGDFERVLAAANASREEMLGMDKDVSYIIDHHFEMRGQIDLSTLPVLNLHRHQHAH
eukprot:m.95443 g.95443  ORF g.95443 m.95443 type:complete len:549 (+) comp26818_c0_seq1:90-1736(+)